MARAKRKTRQSIEVTERAKAFMVEHLHQHGMGQGDFIERIVQWVSCQREEVVEVILRSRARDLWPSKAAIAEMLNLDVPLLPSQDGRSGPRKKRTKSSGQVPAKASA